MAGPQPIGAMPNPFIVELSENEDVAREYNGLPNWVDDALAAATGSAPILLTYYGLPGLGKSYLLKRVKYLIDEGKVDLPSFDLVVARVDFRPIPSETDPFDWMRQAIYSELVRYKNLNNGDDFNLDADSGTPASAQMEITEWIERLHARGARLVLLLDDLHRVYPKRMKGIGDSLSDDDLDTMRIWLAAATIIITMERQPHHPLGRQTRLFASGTLIPAGPLTISRARDFLIKREPLFHGDDVEWILKLTGGHLRLLFQLGRLVWDRYEKTGRLTAASEDDTENRTNLSGMEQELILGQFSQPAAEVFDSYWRYITSMDEKEKNALFDLASNKSALDVSMFGALEQLGLVNLEGDNLDFFSPLFREYIQRKAAETPTETQAPPTRQPVRHGTGALSDIDQTVYDVLARQPGQTFSHAQIYEATWGPFPEGDKEQKRAKGKVQVQILRLRNKLKDASSSEQVESVSREGYRLIRA